MADKKQPKTESNIHFGKVGSKKLKPIQSSNEDDFDNDEDVPCSDDVKSILGFDPDED
jgi:hypothetical protein